MSAQDSRSVRQIEEGIEATRDELAATIDQLVYRTKPSTIIERQKRAALASLHDGTHHADGSLRVDRIAVAAAVVLALVTIGVYRRRRG